MTNCFEPLRTREQPNATVDNGYRHSVACIMAARTYRESRGICWDPRTELILGYAPEAYGARA